MDYIWYRALNLSERLALQGAPGVSAGDGAEQKALAERAERILSEWRSRSPFQADGWFERRLAFDGIGGEAGLRGLLAEPDESLGDRCGDPPAWLGRVLAAFESQDRAPAGPLAVASTFVALVEPLVVESLAQVRAAAERVAAALPADVFDPVRLTDVLFVEVARVLDAVIGRTAALEIQVAKLRGELQGETPEERYQDFVRRLRDPRFSFGLLREYPVLGRLAAELLDLWARTSVELLERLGADWERIRAELLGGLDPGRIESLTGGAGDRHRGGRSVKLIRFTSGLGIVYKPRSLEIDVRLGELLTWLEQRGAPELRIPKVVDRGDYGWAELVPYAPCSSREELERFYHRQGCWLALLHTLNAHDFHSENVIAAGEHPVLVDLETLFGPELWDKEAVAGASAAASELGESVMRVMLLPFLRRLGDEPAAIEASGLGHHDGQLTLSAEPVWEGKHTDEIRIVRRRIEFTAALNRPQIGGESADALDFSTQLVDGFAAMYRLLIRHRVELLAPGSPLLNAADAEVRVVLRPSQLYAVLLGESFHPSLLGDALERDAFFDRLWYGIDSTPRLDLFLSVLRAERADLWRGDLPYFYTRVSSRELRSSTGQPVESPLLASGLEIVLSRLARLDERDLERQTWYVKSSLAGLAWNAEAKLPQPYRRPSRPRQADRGDLLRKAEEIGRRLESLARFRNDEASWIGLTPVIDRGWQLRPLQTDLYSGLPGVILFLAYLGDLLDRREFRELAESALHTLRRQVELQGEETKQIGGFSGWGGLLYLWTHLASLWDDPALLTEAALIVERLRGTVERNQDFDVSLGYAGAIVSLLGFFQATGDPEALDLCRRLGDLLVRRASPCGEGMGWVIDGMGDLPPTGFSHGAAGCAWALSELFEATGDTSYRDTALQAVKYENSHFSEAEDNWADLRFLERKGKIQYMAAWCNGATGIGLSRLRMLRHGGGPGLRRDVDAAVRATLKKGFGNNHCLCHGDLGSLELLLEVDRLGDARGSRELADRTSEVFASIEEHGWICGLPLAVESPGLMEGIAGIGYGLLRLAAPDRVPSVMLLDPPPTAASRENRERCVLHAKPLELRTAGLGECRV